MAFKILRKRNFRILPFVQGFSMTCEVLKAASNIVLIKGTPYISEYDVKKMNSMHTLKRLGHIPCPMPLHQEAFHNPVTLA
jgi:hypothetical protein